MRSEQWLSPLLDVEKPSHQCKSCKWFKCSDSYYLRTWWALYCTNTDKFPAPKPIKEDHESDEEFEESLEDDELNYLNTRDTNPNSNCPYYELPTLPGTDYEFYESR